MGMIQLKVVAVMIFLMVKKEKIKFMVNVVTILLLQLGPKMFPQKI